MTLLNCRYSWPARVVARPAIVGLVMLLVATASSRAADNLPARTEKPLGRLAYPEQPRKQLFVSPRSRHLAYWQSDGEGKWKMVYDGQAGQAYDNLWMPAEPFNPDDDHFAYVASTGGKMGLVLDQSIGKLYDNILADRVTWSPQGGRIAYAAWTGKQGFMVIDGKENGPYDNVLAARFSPDGTRVGYLARRSGKWFAVIDGKEGPTSEDAGVGYPRFSADGKHYLYMPFKGGKMGIAVDGRMPEKYYDGIASHSLLFAPGGDRYAAIAWSGSDYYAIVDGREFGPYLRVDKFAFSPDGRRWAFTARKGDKWLLVADGREGRPYDGISSHGATFSPDSRRLGYVAFVGKKQVVVIDDAESSQYDDTLLHTPVFSPDSRRVAYGARTGTTWRIVMDGKPGDSTYSSLVNGCLTFSPDSKRFAFVTNYSHGTQYYVLDGKSGRAYDAVGQIGFSTDSKHLVAMATVGGKNLAVVDGQDGPAYDMILPIGSPRFVIDQPNGMHFVALNGDSAKVVSQDFGEKMAEAPRTLPFAPPATQPAASPETQPAEPSRK